MEMTVRKNTTVSETEVIVKEKEKSFYGLFDLWNDIFKYHFNWPIRFF